MSSFTIQERVERGAALLDKERPGWFTRLDLKTHQLRSSDHCVLGQEYGFYGAGIVRLGLSTGEEHGFVAGSCSAYTRLRSEWIKVVSERRKARK